MDIKFFEDQFSALKAHIDMRMDSLEKRMDTTEKFIHKMGIDIEAIRDDIRLVAEGHVMLTERFARFESEYIRHAAEMRHDVLNLYKITYGELERRVKELEKSGV